MELDSIIWIITGRCNLNCPYCYAYRYRFEEEIGRETVFRIIDEAYSVGVEYINFTGGEPFLREDLPDILKYALKLGIETSVFSNLTLMDDVKAEIIKKYDSYILTSMDGPKEIYELVKGRGMWSRFIRGLEILREKDVDVHINIPVSRLNYKYVDKTIRLAVDLGVDSLSLIPVMNSGRALETKTFIEREEFLYALEKADQVARELGIGIAVWCTPFLQYIGKYKNLYSSNCRYWKVIDLTPSGKILLCDVTGIIIGDVVKDGLRKSLEKLENNPWYKKIWETPSECKNCIFSNICRGGCYARAYMKYHKIPAPDPLCPLAIYNKVLDG